MHTKTLLTASLAIIPALCAPHCATGETPDRTTLASAVEMSSAAPVPSGWHVATVLLPDAAPSAVPIAAPNSVAGKSKFYLSTLHTSNKLAKQKCPIGKHHEPVDCISKRVRDLLGKFFEEPVVEERVGDFDHDRKSRRDEGEEPGEDEDEDEKMRKAQEALAEALAEADQSLWGPGTMIHVVPDRRDLEGEKEGEEVRKWKPWGEPVEPDVHYFDSGLDDEHEAENEEKGEEEFDLWSPILPPRPVVLPRPYYDNLDGEEPDSEQWQNPKVGDAALWRPETLDALQHELDLENGKSELIPRDEPASPSPLSIKDITHNPPVDTGKYGPFTGDIYWAITNETAWETFGEEQQHSKSTERKIAKIASKLSEYIASNSASETCIAMVKDGEQFARVVVTFGMRGEHIKYNSSEDVRTKLARCEVEEMKKYGDGFEGFEV